MDPLVSLLRSTKERESTAGEALAANVVVEGRYLLTERIGSGGMASVWEATDRTLDRTVAIKFMASIDPKDDASRRRFGDEARVVARLSSSYVVQVHDYGVANGVPFIVMERLVGEDLRQVLTRERRLPVGAVEKIATEVGRALSVVHGAGIVHGDLKPSNVFMATHDDTQTIKLIDFGIARLVGDTSSTAEETMFGTASYMSPEQVRCERKLDPRTDLWSLGAILYRALTGVKPFEGKLADAASRMVHERPRPPSAIVSDLAPAFDAFFETALAPRAEERFQDAGSFAEAFREIAANAFSAVSNCEASPIPKEEESSRVRPVRHRPWRSIVPGASRDGGLLLESEPSEEGRATPIFDVNPALRSEPPTSPIAADALQRLSTRAEAGIRTTGLRLRAPSLSRAVATQTLSGSPTGLDDPFDTPAAGLAIAKIGSTTAKTSTRSAVVVAAVAVAVVGLGLGLTRRERTVLQAVTPPPTSTPGAGPVAPRETATAAAPPVIQAAAPTSEDRSALAALERLRASVRSCVENTIHGLPGTSPAVPSGLAQLESGPYASRKREWIAPFFTCAHFEIEEPMPFALQWQASPELGQGEAIAWVGINGNGIAARAYAFHVTLSSQTLVVGEIESIHPSSPMLPTPASAALPVRKGVAVPTKR